MDDRTAKQIEKRISVFDMLVSMYSQLHDTNQRWAIAFDCFEILTAALLCGVTFFDFSSVSITSTISLNTIMGFVSITLFGVTLINQRLKLKEKAEKYHMAGIMYNDAKNDLKKNLSAWRNEGANEEVVQGFLNDRYQELAKAPPIPENKFHKLKHHHQYKVAFSKFLDEHKSTPWILCKIKFVFGKRE